MNDAERHIHLSPLGGMAGDMFIAAMLDTFPDLVAPLFCCVESLIGKQADLRLTPGRYSGLAGARFEVQPRRVEHGGHRSWASIREQLQSSALEETVTRRAVAIFAILAEAEAAVHDTEPDKVHFHEVGALDSIVDIVGAAFLIESMCSASWSVGSLPLGSGTVATQHGILPVPAPATTRLLEGFRVHVDGLAGERVTPTGAAILCHLRSAMQDRMAAGELLLSGMGFGARQLADRPNVLRILVTDTRARTTTAEQIAVVRFEVDDQTGEDLAVALDDLRSMPDVVDAVQIPVFGKKGRVMVSVQLLVRPAAVAEVSARVFAQTTTLGLRVAIEERQLVPRDERVSTDGVRVKLARRPGARTAKADIDEVAARAVDHAGRQRVRAAAETQVATLESGCEKAKAGADRVGKSMPPAKE